ncbi:polysaccharide biosynthesis tyrosine autokinase [candidate division KSB1 bacterium]|nr:polysaccharide biosynthesis tyrosine autokinase [candidate division KSB1 bacterium]
MVDQNDQLYFDGEEEEEGSFDLNKFLNGIKKRKWLVAIIIFLVTIPWMIYVKLEAPIYEAETVLRFKDYAAENYSYIQRTRWTELSSQRFLRKVAQELGLSLHINNKESKKNINRHQIFKDFSTSSEPKAGDYSLTFGDYGAFELRYFPSDIKEGVVLDSGYVSDYTYNSFSMNGLKFTFVENIDSLPPEVHFTIQKIKSAVETLQSQLMVSFREDATLLNLRLSGSDPILVAKTVNSLAEIYKRESIDIKESDTSKKLRILKQQLELAEEKLNKSSGALKEFERTHFLGLDSELGSQTQERETVRTQIDALEMEKERLISMIDRLNTEIQNSGRRYSTSLKLHFNSLLQMPTFDTNSEIRILGNKLAELESRRESQLNRVTEDHPTIKQLNDEILSVYWQIESAAKTHLDALNLRIRQSQRRISTIDQRLNSMPQEKLHQQELEREWQRDQENFDKLKTEVQTLEMNLTVETENIEIFQKAEVPELPVNADKKKRALIGFLVSIVLGLGVAILLEFMDKSIQTTDDIKKFLKLKVMGTIPVINFTGTDDFKDEEKIKKIDEQIVTHDYSPTPIGEAYRSLRTNLLFSKQNGKIHTLVITSTAPGDGKSFTSSNIAISMAQQRSNTLLVDADLRRGVIHNTFGISKEPGFTNFLTNSHTFSQVIRETYIPNLSVVPCGSLIPNPSEVLGSLQMKRFLEQAKRRFEIIIFDSPPLNAATDAVVIGTQVDGVVLVVRSGVTNRDVAKLKLEMFRNVPAKILGVVLNGAEANLAHDGYSYYHY